MPERISEVIERGGGAIDYWLYPNIFITSFLTLNYFNIFLFIIILLGGLHVLLNYLIGFINFMKELYCLQY